MRRPLERARILRRTDDRPTLPANVKRILRKYGATLLMPGPAGILQYGFQPGNYKESTGQNLAAVDQQVGLVVDAAWSLGPELLTNGGFDTTESWTLNNGWVISGGKATKATTGTAGNCAQSINLSGKQLIVSFTVSDVTAGVVSAVLVQTGVGTTSQAVSSNGTYSFRMSRDVVDTFRFTADASFNGSIDNVSVREVTGIHASQATSGYQPYLRQSGGVNSWQFDGVDDRLSLSAVPFQTQDVSFAIIAFMPLAADGGVGRRLFGFGGNGSEIALLTSNAGLLFNVRGDTGNQSSINGGATATNTPFVATCIQAGSSRSLRVDSVPKGSDAVIVSSSTANAATLGNRAAGDRQFNGHIHGVIFGKGAISNSELRTLEKFAAKLQGRSL